MDNGRKSAVKPWERVRGMRASEEIVTQIHDAFFKGMRPGDWLGTEPELAARFGVSRITIRDAIRTLEAEGVVDIRVGAGGGIRVAESSPERYVQALSIQLHLMGLTWKELTEAQSAIEQTTTRLAARLATPEQIAEMYDLIHRSQAEKNDPKQFTELALDFHEAIARASGNRALWPSLHSIILVQRYRLQTKTSPELAEQVADIHHTSILEAIEARDEDLAVARMMKHLQSISESDDEA